MPRRQQRHDFIAEQRQIAHPRPVAHLRHHRQIGSPIQQQIQRLGQKSAHQIQLGLRMFGTVGIHCWHQPVKAGMALHRNTQLLRRMIGRKTQHLGARRLHFWQRPPRRHQQTLPRRRQTQRALGTIQQAHAKIALQSPELMRQRRLGQMHPLRRRRHRTGLG